MAFKQMPNNWDLLKLADVAEVKYGKAKPKEIGKIPVIGSGGIYGHTENALIDFPTIIIGRKGTAGLAWLQEQPCWPSDTTFYLNWKNEKIDYNYLYYYLKGHPLSGQHARTTLPSLLKQDLENYSLFVPPIPEQRAIARALHAVQGAREARLREMALEKERKAALMEHLFTHGTRGEATKMTEIGEMPESWDVVELSNLCIERQGFIQTGPFGSQLHSSDYRKCGIPVVNPTHLGYNTINEEHLPFIDKKDADRLSKHYLIKGDILISRRGDFKRYSYITDHQSGWLCGTGCILIRVNNPNVDNYFLSVLMGHNLIQNYFDLNSVGSIMPNLNTKILLGLPIILPHIEEQRMIASVLRACDSKIAALDHEACLHDELFRAMLEELMSGRLPAGTLVEDAAQS